MIIINANKRNSMHNERREKIFITIVYAEKKAQGSFKSSKRKENMLLINLHKLN